MSKILVSNLPESATQDSVRVLFARHGRVQDVAMIKDRGTGRPRGMAFVVMSAREAICAIQNLNGHDMDGCALRVDEAQEPSKNRFGWLP
jgi:RNA recognition motif-containing protein